MNIDDSSQFRNCTSCQLCGAVCPTSAISIRLNTDGFYRPVINSDKCIDCGLCVQNCYKFDTDIKQSDLSGKKIYAAWANDSKVIEETTSGGIADTLARYLINLSYVCIGVGYNCESNRAEGAIAYTEQETLQFRGSKYIQSYSVKAFKTLVGNCKKEKFAIFGLPCQIYAIDKFLTKRKIRDNHILVDLYCHGCPSLNLWNKYNHAIKLKNNGSKVLSANFRSKVRGWGNFYVLLLLLCPTKNGEIEKEVVSKRINNPFYELFFSDLILNDSCTDCELRSTLEYTDIRLGDFWGKSYISNRRGVSGVTICTNRGESIWESISNSIHKEERTFSDFLPYQSYGKRYSINPSLRAKLLTSLSNENENIDDCIKIYRKSMSVKAKIKHVLKNCIKLMPQSFIAIIKRGFYSLR